MTNPNEFLFDPNIRIYGPIDGQAVRDFLDQLDRVRQDRRPITLELTTNGGDADAARRIALEIRICREHHGLATHFVGKTAVMSAGITIMAAFPRNCRYLTGDTLLLIHERRLNKTIEFDGPVRANLQIANEILAELKAAEAIERSGFAELAAGSALDADELYERAKTNLYLTAHEALEQRLIEAVL